MPDVMFATALPEQLASDAATGEVEAVSLQVTVTDETDMQTFPVVVKQLAGALTEPVPDALLLAPVPPEPEPLFCEGVVGDSDPPPHAFPASNATRAPTVTKIRYDVRISLLQGHSGNEVAGGWFVAKRIL
jgi:hypothetical protein